MIHLADTTPSHEWFTHYRGILDNAVATIKTRGYWSAYPESPSPRVYGETAAAEGKAAFDALLGTPFDLNQPGTVGTVSDERSAFGLAMNIAYPKADLDLLVPAVRNAMRTWAKASIISRVGVALEALDRINKASFAMAHATMHTTGQGFMMAFQAGGPHAQDRALEAVAYAYDAMIAVPETAYWEKPQGKNEPLRIDKKFELVPRGIGLVIGCTTFPGWNSYPGLFASLVTGNGVIVKPHPLAVLPLAMTVKILRETLNDSGFDPNVVVLVADELADPIAKKLAERPEIAIIDYTGGSSFGTWLEDNAKAIVYTEKAGINSAVIDSTDDLAGMTRNLAMSLSLYSGQMCTTPQNLFIPRDGITANGERLSFDDTVAAITGAIDALLSVPERAVELLGAIAADATLERIDTEAAAGGVVRPSVAIENPAFPNARVRTPLVIALDAKDEARYGREMFGPIVYAIATAGTHESLTLATREAVDHGAITAVVYSTDYGVLNAAEEHARIAGVSLAENLTGTLLVNQSAAFSDYHVTGANPAGNASLTDSAFVANRFRVVETRTPRAAAAASSN
jgi:phenylacetic acid degradation protein paaN